VSFCNRVGGATVGMRRGRRLWRAPARSRPPFCLACARAYYWHPSLRHGAAPPLLPTPGASAPDGRLDASLVEWLEASGPAFQQLLEAINAAHARRVEWLASAAGEARRTVWWPFTQHGSVEPG
jgi:dethiobiotin synthetase/adenosylmethionine--8-amino-7-oxononanoate aminotransferase